MRIPVIIGLAALMQSAGANGLGVSAGEVEGFECAANLGSFVLATAAAIVATEAD